ncbi:urease accessory protein UreD [Leptolyngbya sp. AN02str]|uniref:urease accessory protein UreD n=1 Tax=Leptolyngbya sp. AN02str TaxID=3423363 RepID=UPI003D3133B8
MAGVEGVGLMERAGEGQGWLGKLGLEFAWQDGKTLMQRCAVQAPLKVQRPFYPEGDTVCHVVSLHTAGGIVGGDRFRVEVQLHPEAQVLMTTAAAGKVYRSTGIEAGQELRIQVGEGACLEWLPQETIVFDGAMMRQQTRIDLAEGALWLGWEVLRLGRTARGERFDHGMWRSRTEVWQHGRPLWIDPQWIEGGSATIDSLHGLANCPVVGSFAVLGQSVTPELVTKARELWQTMPSNATDALIEHRAEVGVTRLMSGMLCRYRGHSTLEAKRWLALVWDLVRQEMLGRSPYRPRVW